jgi:hypothetical protein
MNYRYEATRKECGARSPANTRNSVYVHSPFIMHQKSWQQQRVIELRLKLLEWVPSSREEWRYYKRVTCEYCTDRNGRNVLREWNKNIYPTVTTCGLRRSIKYSKTYKKTNWQKYVLMEQAIRPGPWSDWSCWCYRFVVAPVAAAGGLSDGDMNW